MADTTNFAWTKPTVGGDTGAWGTILNTLFDDVDADLNTVKTTADAAMPTGGGTFTGRVRSKSTRHTAVDLGSVSGTTTLDTLAANFFTLTIAGNTTIAFSNVAPTDAVFVVLHINNGGNHTITWPAVTLWPGGAVPTLTVDGGDTVVMYTRNGGSGWVATLAIEDWR